MLARRLTTILPMMILAKAIETTPIHSIADLTGARTALVTTRPLRAPPQTISDVGGSVAGRCPCRARCRWRTIEAYCPRGSQNIPTRASPPVLTMIL
jgi:predicted ATPase with chaperone activity